MPPSKIRNSQLLLAATTLPASYDGSWVSAKFNTIGVEELKVLCTVAGGFDGTSVEIKSQAVDDTTGAAANYTELKPDGTLDEVTVLAAEITSEGGVFALAFGCKAFDAVRFLAKRTGGASGDMALRVLGG